MDYSLYLFTDKPIPYKKLLFYPVKVRDYIEFLWYVDCLLIDKNAIPDIKIISMSYLDFLFYLAEQDDSIHLHKLIMLLSVVLKENEENIKLYKKDGKPYVSINDELYDNKDLMEIKNIIFEQNDIEDIDYTIQKELRDSLKAAEEMKAKLSGIKPGTFEDSIICLMTALPGVTLEEIYDMPIRKFNKALKRADHKLHYEIYLAASMSGMVTFKDKNALKHWMSSLDSDDKYSDVTMGLDELHNKIS